MIPGIGVVFKRLDALLELKEHVETDYHHFFQVRVRNLLVEKVPRYKCS